jgi:hypothetical protein
MMLKLGILWVTAVGLGAATIAADSTRGAYLFETLSCVQCHSINGIGGTMAPDLGRKVDRNFTPATDLALATGMPVKVSPKFWAEHMGIPKTRLMLSVDQRERLFEPEWLAPQKLDFANYSLKIS